MLDAELPQMPKSGNVPFVPLKTLNQLVPS
jgi:hypothetical protein